MFVKIGTKLPFTIKNKRKNTNLKFKFKNFFIFTYFMSLLCWLSSGLWVLWLELVSEGVHLLLDEASLSSLLWENLFFSFSLIRILFSGTTFSPAASWASPLNYLSANILLQWIGTWLTCWANWFLEACISLSLMSHQSRGSLSL